jgi:Protein of unknown function (DUF3396)
MDLAAFSKVEDGVTIVTPSLEIVAFSSESLTTAADGYGAALNAFREGWGDSLRWWRGTDMKRFRAVDPVMWESLTHSFGPNSTDRKATFIAHAGATSRDSGVPALEFARREEERVAMIRVSLPPQGDPAADASLLRAFVDSAVSMLPFSSGYVGYGLYWNQVDVSISRAAPELAAPWLLRHPGLAYGNPFDFMWSAPYGVIDVNWFTLVGPDALQRLGGIDALARARPEGIEVRSLSAGCVIQAGRHPEIGDVNRGERLPLYAAAARLIAAARAPDEVIEEITIDGMSEEQMERWLGRFFA